MVVNHRQRCAIALGLPVGMLGRSCRSGLRRSRFVFVWAIVWAVLAMLLVGCGGDAGQPLVANGDGITKVRLALNWFPEAEHGGFYAALEHGYYRDAGLDVEIIPGGPNAPVIQEVITGQVEFGVTNADQIFLGRSKGANVTALLAPLQDGPRCIMVHGSSGIESFEDLNNMTIALSEAKPFAMYLKKKLPLENVEFVPYPGSVAEFMTNEKFAQQAYIFSEPFTARQKGGDPKTLMLSDFGFNLYSSVLFADEKTLTKSSDVVKAMVTASARGWQRYLADPEPTNTFIHEANSHMGLEILGHSVGTLKDLCQTADDQPFGVMTDERWQTLHDQMLDIGAITKPIPIADVFTTRYLD